MGIKLVFETPASSSLTRVSPSLLKVQTQHHLTGAMAENVTDQ